MIAKIPATLWPAMVNRQTFQAFGVFSSDNEEVALLSSVIGRRKQFGTGLICRAAQIGTD